MKVGPEGPCRSCTGGPAPPKRAEGLSNEAWVDDCQANSSRISRRGEKWKVHCAHTRAWFLRSRHFAFFWCFYDFLIISRVSFRFILGSILDAILARFRIYYFSSGITSQHILWYLLPPKCFVFSWSLGSNFSMLFCLFFSDLDPAHNFSRIFDLFTKLLPSEIHKFWYFNCYPFGSSADPFVTRPGASDLRGFAKQQEQTMICLDWLSVFLFWILACFFERVVSAMC